MKKIFDGIADGANKATSIIGKAREKVVDVIDQDGDGEFNKADISIIADAIGNVTKKTAVNLKAGIDDKSRELEKNILKPIFADELNSTDFYMSKLIRITDIDKKHAESEVCKDSIGYMFAQKDLNVVNLFTDKVDEFGLTFYPDRSYEIYYVDPTDRDRYIALDLYFSYLKEARVNELQKVAQDLGAKHFKITYQEEKVSFTNSDENRKANGKAFMKNGNVEEEKRHESSEIINVEIAAEASFMGHNPVEPKLKFLQREPSIQSLISMRMDESAPLLHQKYTLKLSNSSGIKETDAVKIDAALKVMKIAGNTTVTNEVKNEARRMFEYEIDF